MELLKFYTICPRGPPEECQLWPALMGESHQVLLYCLLWKIQSSGYNQQVPKWTIQQWRLSNNYQLNLVKMTRLVNPNDFIPCWNFIPCMSYHSFIHSYQSLSKPQTAKLRKDSIKEQVHCHNNCPSIYISTSGLTTEGPDDSGPDLAEMPPFAEFYNTVKQLAIGKGWLSPQFLHTMEEYFFRIKCYIGKFPLEKPVRSFFHFLSEMQKSAVSFNMEKHLLRREFTISMVQHYLQTCFYGGEASEWVLKWFRPELSWGSQATTAELGHMDTTRWCGHSAGVVASSTPMTFTIINLEATCQCLECVWCNQQPLICTPDRGLQ